MSEAGPAALTIHRNKYIICDIQYTFCGLLSSVILCYFCYIC